MLYFMLDTCTSLSLNLLFAVNLLNKLKAGIMYDTTGAPGLILLVVLNKQNINSRFPDGGLKLSV